MNSTQNPDQEYAYVLITPMRNESSNLLQLKTTILSQTHRPSIWVIVDSGSSDGSLEKARSLTGECDWIHVVSQKSFPDEGYSHKNFAQAINEGYTKAIALSNELGLRVEFVGKTDCTPALSKGYFERLAHELKSDPNLVIVCGIQRLYIGSKEITIQARNPTSLSGFNDIRLYRRDFLERTGGYPLTHSPDTVLLVKAIIEGSRTRIVEDAFFTKTRLGGSRIGIWQGYRLKGKSFHYLGYPIGAAALNAMYHSMILRPHYIGIPFFLGYIIAFMNREERIDDKEVFEYLNKRSMLKEAFHQ